MSARPCIGCRRLIPSGSYCPSCKAERFPSSPDRLRGGAWMKRRRLILNAYEWRCAACDAMLVPLEIHHLNHDHTDNRWENTVPLCRPCHARAGEGEELEIEIRGTAGFLF